MDARFAVVIPYLGTAPEWWPLWLQGAAANQEIHFLLFTDCLRSDSSPPNVKVHEASLRSLRNLAERKLGVPVALTTPRKLCDIKPLYGHIFEDYLDGYEFWGYGDIDVVYGKLSRFLHRALVSRADLVSFRSGWLSGSLVLARNTVSTSRLYKTDSRWVNVVREEKYLLFDELGGMFFGARLEGVPFEDLPAPLGSFSGIVDLAERDGSLRVFRGDFIQEHLRLGDVLLRSPDGIRELRTGRDFAYYHLVIDKRRFFSCPTWVVSPERYYITGTGIYPVHGFGGVKQRCRALSRVLGGGCRACLRRLRGK